jgi:hypothetical protein
MPNFQVQSVRHRGKKAWAVVRHERGIGPVMVGIHYASPSLALEDANRLNRHAQTQKGPVAPLRAAEKVRIGIVCPACGQTGSVQFDDNACAVSPYSNDMLTGLSQEFYFRVPRSHVGPMEVVCAKCGAVFG